MNILLAKPILDIVGNVLDRVLPDKEAAAKAKLEFTTQAAQMDQAEVSEFHDFVVSYEGAGDKVGPGLQFLRGSVRPVLTYALACLYGWGFLHPGTFTAEHMQGLYQLNLISLGFWYGERALKNLGLNLSRKAET
jgi:hypothetical protein